MYRYKFYMLSATILGALLIGATFFISSIVREQLENNLIENYIEEEKLIAHNIARTLESEIDSIKNKMHLMGENPIIKSGITEKCNEEINRQLILIDSKLGNVARVNKDGFFKCTLNPSLLNTQASAIGSHIEDIFNDPTHNPVMSRVASVPGLDSYAVALHVPVWKEGQFDGTLGGAVYLNDIGDRYLKDVVFAQRGYVVLIDDDGTVLYHRIPSLIGKRIDSFEFNETIGASSAHEKVVADTALGKSGEIRYKNITQGEKIGAYEPVEVLQNRNWAVLVTVPTSDVESEVGGIGVGKLLTLLSIFITLMIILAVSAFIVVCNKLIFNPIKEIQEMKSDFVSLVSHQLKTPVAQIKGYVENMLEGLTGTINDKQREYLSDMLVVANKNSQLIDDLLNVSRIERKMLKVNIEAIDINQLIEEVLKPLRDVAKNKGVLLTESLLSGVASISGDPIKTREAIRNIVDNAIKFTESGKKVSINVRNLDESVLVSVSDEGPGIDPNVEKELFEKKRVWTGKVKASGAGLGLYLSKQFIELTGGIIKFETKSGKGTTFNITLPKIKI